jgi:hypothetical protein
VRNTSLSQHPSPDQSDRVAAPPSESIGSAEKSLSTLLLLPMAERQPRRGILLGIAALMLIGNVSPGLNEAEASRAQAAAAPANQTHTAQIEGITIEAEMPRDVSGSLNTDVIFVFEATSDGEWKEQPVADIVIGNAITYLPPPGARTLGFVAGEATAAIDLEPGFAGRICLELETSSRSDFLRSLGYRRSTTITGIRPALTDQATCSAYFASENRDLGPASQVYAHLDGRHDWIRTRRG